MGAGLIATSRIHHLWIGYLTYGIGVGIGVAFTYIPMLAVVGGWFNRHRTSALGIAVSGIGAGTLIVAPSAAALIARVGWRESYVIMGIAAAILIAICGLISAPAPVHVITGEFYSRVRFAVPNSFSCIFHRCSRRSQYIYRWSICRLSPMIMARVKSVPPRWLVLSARPVLRDASGSALAPRVSGSCNSTRLAP
jgi:MFS family permease